MAGMSGMVDDLEVRMNRAAEAATPIAQDLLVPAFQLLSSRIGRHLQRPSDSPSC